MKSQFADIKIGDAAKGVSTRALSHEHIFGKIFWNVIGICVPLAIAAIVIPKLLLVIGAERFGLLALAWGLIGYAGTIDLGIGRATTQQVSELRGGVGEHLVPTVLATAIRLTSLTGGIGMLLIAIAALGGAYRFIHADSVPAVEVELAMLLLALALPMQAISATYRGINEAYLNFKSISLLRIFLGAANFGAPYLVALYTKELHWLVATLVLSRALALVFYRQFAHACMARQGHAGTGRYTADYARRLLHFGGWFAVSSVVSPLLVQADRFFIGALISASAVTVYVLPYEIAVQSLVFTGAVTSVVFPLISNLVIVNAGKAAKLFYEWLWRLAGLMLVVTVVLALVIPDLLRLWLGPQVTQESIRTGQILCAGVFFNSIGAMYFSLLHAYRKTRQTALLHLLELPIFIAALYLLIGSYGVVGAALAWVLRVAIDTLALIVIVARSKDICLRS